MPIYENVPWKNSLLKVFFLKRVFSVREFGLDKNFTRVQAVISWWPSVIYSPIRQKLRVYNRRKRNTLEQWSPYSGLSYIASLYWRWRFAKLTVGSVERRQRSFYLEVTRREGTPLDRMSRLRREPSLWMVGWTPRNLFRYVHRIVNW